MTPLTREEVALVGVAASDHDRVLALLDELECWRATREWVPFMVRQALEKGDVEAVRANAKHREEWVAEQVKERDAALAQVAALHAVLVELVNGEDESTAHLYFKAEAAIADTTKAAAEHDAAVRKEARRAALEEAAMLMSEDRLDPIGAKMLRALAASEPEGE